MESTTKRYKANLNCSDSCLDLQDYDDYKYGCEFEFYINKDLDFKQTIEKIRKEIFKFSNVDILVNLVTLPLDLDKDNCIQIKPDYSLEDNGVEISIPISSKQGVIYYLENIFPIIEKYAYTNEDTGLHFHISTAKKDGVNFNFYVYMLMCHDKGLLSSWKYREDYSHNVMDILFNNTKITTRKIKSKKGTIWNLEKISSNHVEIKSIGGINYHKKIEKIKMEFALYSDCFHQVYKDPKSCYIEKLIAEHKMLVSSVSAMKQKEFAKAVDDARLIE